MNNNITNFDTIVELFPNAETLLLGTYLIMLGYNKIKKIDGNSLNKMKNLKLLNLNENKVYEISGTT